MREMLKLPDTHRIGIVPGSDTGAFEMAMWTMLGAVPSPTLAWESFGEGWVTDAVKQLKLDPTVLRADYGQLPDLTQVDWSNDVLFTWNGTTSGVRVPNGDWIPDDREGLSFADATSAVFAYDMPWDKIDVATFSWQKVLGGEGGHGVLILGPRAVERLEELHPRLAAAQGVPPRVQGRARRGRVQGRDDQHPVDARRRGRDLRARMGEVGRRREGLIAAPRRQCRGARQDRRERELARPSRARSRDPVEDQRLPDGRGRRRGLIKKFASLLEAEGAAYDIAGYRDAPAGLRIWCGATVDTADIEALGPWLDWAYATVKAA
jgi:phosphoserine aminotransferase